MNRLYYLLLLQIMAAFACADGKVFKGRDLQSLFPVLEEEQRAIISHKDGYQSMLLAVNFNLEDDEQAFWLFPVLGKPEQIKIDVSENFPRFFGKKPEIIAKEKIEILSGIQILTQPYTWPFCCLMPALGTVGIQKDIQVHSAVEKYGLKIETLKAASVNALSGYLNQKGIGLPSEEYKVYESYLTEEYTLVCVSISSMSELLKNFPDLDNKHSMRRGRWPCVYVEFPTDQIYFPLKPTSTYTGALKVSLSILGYVEPTDTIDRGQWEYKYYIQKELPDNFPAAMYPEDSPIRYTRAVFYDEAAQLKEDLFLAPAEINSIGYAEFLIQFNNDTIGIIFAFIVILQSWICAGLSGWIVKRKWFPYAYLGLFNMLTIFGVYFAAKYGKGIIKTELTGKEHKMARDQFLLIFTLLFIFTSILMNLVLYWPLNN